MRFALASVMVAGVGASHMPELALTVNQADGSFDILLHGCPWLSGSEYRMGSLSSSVGDLVLTSSAELSGSDVFGKYSSTSLSWAKQGSSDVIMETSFREYEEDTGLLVFRQSFPKALDMASFSAKASSLAASTIFPSFARSGAAPADVTWGTCRVGQGGNQAVQEYQHTSDHSEEACGATCARSSACLAFDYSKTDKYNSCRLFNSLDARLGEGGDDSRMYCQMDLWTCEVGQGGSGAGQEYKETSDGSEDSCGASCAKSSGCMAFDYTKRDRYGSCRLFSNKGARHGDGGADSRRYCSMKGRKAALDCFSYHGTFPSMKACTLDTYAESKMGGAPLVLYNSSDEALPMTVFSPLNQPMAHHMAHSDSFIGAGVKATVETIPAGWEQMFVLSAGAGINAGMMSWGDRLLKYTGRPRVDNRYLDDSHGGIGFWTDNGGYYHYSIGNNKSLGSNYEEVLPKVKAYHDKLGMPFKHWQFDSWFYPKDGGVEPGGGGGAVTNWTADPKIFPTGMANIQNLLGLPTIMHNRQWSTKSDYIKNWPDIEWYSSSKAAVPKDPVKFFDRFFTQQEGWGLSMYEQDWMVTEYDLVEALQKNITMGDLWLYGMAEGAAKSKRTVQYCMPTPNEVLSAASLPAVTNARATGDYFHSSNQWAVGNTALFYWALNVLPFKDGFYSSTNKQDGGQTVGPEKNPDREALMATLSAAMVGPMDGIYLLNKSRVMSTCRADGTVLKPDRPITATDTCFRNANPTCKVYETYSAVPGLGTVHYYYNDAGSAAMTADEVYLKDAQQEHAVYNWYSGELTKLRSTNRLAPGYEGHIYAVVTPITRDGWIFIGEPRTFVTASTLRFQSVHSESGKLNVRVHGVAGETVEVCAAHASELATKICKSVFFDSEADLSVEFGTDDAAIIV